LDLLALLTEFSEVLPALLDGLFDAVLDEFQKELACLVGQLQPTFLTVDGVDVNINSSTT